MPLLDDIKSEKAITARLNFLHSGHFYALLQEQKKLQHRRSQVIDLR